MPDAKFNVRIIGWVVVQIGNVTTSAPQLGLGLGAELGENLLSIQKIKLVLKTKLVSNKMGLL